MDEKAKKKTILVIDDDTSLTRIASSNLKACGYEVIISNDAPEGLEKALKQSPDLILLDVMMPIVNGYNFCRLLKSQQEHKNIPIILLTSRSSDEDIRIGKEVGANAYITKPFKTEDLLSAIQGLIGVSQQSS